MKKICSLSLILFFLFSSQILSMESQNNENFLELILQIQEDGYITNLQFSPNNKYLCGTLKMNNSKKVLSVWELKTGKRIFETVNFCRISKPCFSSKDRYFIIGDNDNTVKVFDIDSNTTEPIFTLKNQCVNSNLIDKNEKYLIEEEPENLPGKIRLLNLEDNEKSILLDNHNLILEHDYAVLFCDTGKGCSNYLLSISITSGYVQNFKLLSFDYYGNTTLIAEGDTKNFHTTSPKRCFFDGRNITLDFLPSLKVIKIDQKQIDASPNYINHAEYDYKDKMYRLVIEFNPTNLTVLPSALILNTEIEEYYPHLELDSVNFWQDNQLLFIQTHYMVPNTETLLFNHILKVWNVKTNKCLKRDYCENISSAVSSEYCNLFAASGDGIINIYKINI